MCLAADWGSFMKKFAMICAGLGIALAGCNQTAQQAAIDPAAPPPVVTASAPASAPPPVAASAGENMQALPPIYNPLVDLNGRQQARFDRDHAACRLVAEPQERAARAAMQDQQAGTAIAVAGALSGFIPVRGFNNAVNVARAGGAAQDIGGGIAAGGAARNAQATEDYALVVNNCLRRRGYVLLRD